MSGAAVCFVSLLSHVPGIYHVESSCFPVWAGLIPSFLARLLIILVLCLARKSSSRSPNHLRFSVKYTAKSIAICAVGNGHKLGVDCCIDLTQCSKQQLHEFVQSF